MSKVNKIDHRKVIDATTDIELTVLERDIKTANLKCPGNCAVAKAIRRTFNEECRIHISRTYVFNKEQQAWLRYVTPPSMRTEIISFDRGGEFVAGTWTLHAPRVWEKAEARKAYKDSLSKSNRAHKTKRTKPIQVQDIRTGPASGA
jgi:hypothetical protein